MANEKYPLGVPVPETPYRKITEDEADLNGYNGFARKDGDGVWRRYCIKEQCYWDDGPLNKLANRFNYHPPQDQATGDAHMEVRVTLLTATERLWAMLPASRERALFVTKMEEAMFWANAAIARNPVKAADGQGEMPV